MGVEVLLADGTVRFGDAVALAVGHEEQPAHGHGIAVRADSADDTPLSPDAPVLILGSGLSMVDAWLSLSGRQHRGRITIVSRHGLLPLEHRQAAPIRIDAADVPFGTSLGYFMNWFRELVAAEAPAGQDWRSVVDGLRPYKPAHLAELDAGGTAAGSRTCAAVLERAPASPAAGAAPPHARGDRGRTARIDPGQSGDNGPERRRRGVHAAAARPGGSRDHAGGARL